MRSSSGIENPCFIFKAIIPSQLVPASTNHELDDDLSSLAWAAARARTLSFFHPKPSGTCTTTCPIAWCGSSPAHRLAARLLRGAVTRNWSRTRG